MIPDEQREATEKRANAFMDGLERLVKEHGPSDLTEIERRQMTTEMTLAAALYVASTLRKATTFS